MDKEPLTLEEVEKNCKKVIKLTKCDGVKIEGGLKKIKIIKKVSGNGISVNHRVNL